MCMELHGTQILLKLRMQNMRDTATFSMFSSYQFLSELSQPGRAFFDLSFKLFICL